MTPGSSDGAIIRTGFLGDGPRDLKDLEENWKDILDAKEPRVGRLQNESPEVLEEGK